MQNINQAWLAADAYLQTDLPSEDTRLSRPRNTMQIQHHTATKQTPGFDYSLTLESVLEDVNYSTQKNPTA